MSKDKSTLKLVEPHVDAETRVHDDHHLSVRLWLRMLSCTNRIENFGRTHSLPHKAFTPFCRVIERRCAMRASS